VGGRGGLNVKHNGVTVTVTAAPAARRSPRPPLAAGAPCLALFPCEVRSTMQRKAQGKEQQGGGVVRRRRRRRRRSEERRGRTEGSQKPQTQTPKKRGMQRARKLVSAGSFWPFKNDAYVHGSIRTLLLREGPKVQRFNAQKQGLSERASLRCLCSDLLLRC
jgi:hypothetical protein